MVVTSQPRYAYYSRRQPDLAVSKFVSSSKRVSRQPARHAASRRCRVQRIRCKSVRPPFLPLPPPLRGERKSCSSQRPTYRASIVVVVVVFCRLWLALPLFTAKEALSQTAGAGSLCERVIIIELYLLSPRVFLARSISPPPRLVDTFLLFRKFSRIENFGIVDRGNVIYSTLCQGFRFNKLSNDTSENPFQKGYYILIEILLRKLCIDYRLLNRESFQKKIFFDGGRLKLDVHSVYYAT